MRRFYVYILFCSLLALSCGKTPDSNIQDELPSGNTADTDEPNLPHRYLVAYFSFTGNTAKVANDIADIIAPGLVSRFRIEPNVPYGNEDLIYYSQESRAYQEQNGTANQRPIIKDLPPDLLSNCAVVLLGFPVWYGKVPKIVYSFLDSYDFTNINIIPFITSESSGIESIEQELKEAYPSGPIWRSGAKLDGKKPEELEQWLHTYRFYDFGQIPTTYMKMQISAENGIVTAYLADTPAGRSLNARLVEGPVTVTMRTNEFEHYGPLGFSLPSEDEDLTATEGDIFLWNGDNICIFYGTNTGAYTRIGRIEENEIPTLRSTFVKDETVITMSK